MKLPICFPSLIALIALTACSQRPEPEIHTNGGISGEYQSLNADQEARDYLTRLEQFVARYQPTDGTDYEDSVHVRYYRIAQYDLMYQYAANGRKNDAQKILNWLKSTDKDIQ